MAARTWNARHRPLGKTMTLLERAVQAVLDQEKGLVLVNYKEPLLKVEDGFGYVGAILTTIDGEKIQCHICGSLFSALGPHLYKTHETNVSEYKERFELARETALVSEKYRRILKERSIKFYASICRDISQTIRRTAARTYTCRYS